MADVIVLVILAALTAGIVGYLVHAKKRGQKCVGCPYAKKCAGACGGQTNAQ